MSYCTPEPARRTAKVLIMAMTISLSGSADVQKHLAAIDNAPIDTDRMKIAVTAVGLVGHVTSLRFQRDYESALAMVPSGNVRISCSFWPHARRHTAKTSRSR
jgi:hypothetical protein